MLAVEAALALHAPSTLSHDTPALKHTSGDSMHPRPYGPGEIARTVPGRAQLTWRWTNAYPHWLPSVARWSALRSLSRSRLREGLPSGSTSVRLQYAAGEQGGRPWGKNGNLRDRPPLTFGARPDRRVRRHEPGGTSNRIGNATSLRRCVGRRDRHLAHANSN